MQKINLKSKKTIALCLTGLAVFSIGAFTACEETEEEFSLKEETVVLDFVQDLHIQKNETLDLSFLPDGVSLNTASVDSSKVGSYEIIYTYEGAQYAKKAYVYDAPQFSMNGETVVTARSLTYQEANALNMLSAETFGITAKDSFGMNLKIDVSFDKAYLGECGEYTFFYQAVDLAENVSKISVVYTITGENKELDSVLADITDERFSVSVDLGDSTIEEIVFDGLYLEEQFYEIFEDEIRFKTVIFEELGLRYKEEYDILIKTKDWSAKCVLERTDSAPIVCANFPFYNYIFLEGEKIVLPMIERINQQGYQLTYSMEGAMLTYDEYTNTATVTSLNGGSLPTGKYYVTATATQNGKASVEKKTMFQICGEEDYARMLAPLNGQFEDNIHARNTNWALFTYDKAKNAFKRGVVWNEGDNHSMLAIPNSGNILSKWIEGFGKYPYVALELCFDGVMGEDFNNFTFYFNGGYEGTRFKLTDSAVKIYDMDGYAVSATELKSNTWYDVFVPCVAKPADYNNWGYYFMTQNSTIPGTSPGVFAGQPVPGYVYTDYWVRNVRFDNVTETVTLQNGYIYEESNMTGLLPKSATAYTLTKAPDGVTLNGNRISSLKVGEYTAVGDTTVSFRVYTATEYDKIIATLTSTQYDGCVGTRNSNWATFTFDDTEGAYKFHPTKIEQIASGYVDNHMAITLSGSAVDKILANVESKTYAYVALDLKYSGTMGTDFHSFTFSNTGTRVGFKAITDSSIKVCNQNGEIINVTTMQAGEWYTVYMPAPTTFTSDLSVYFFIRQQCRTAGEYTDYWVRNLRFATEIPTV